jgi:hypothetical protein
MAAHLNFRGVQQSLAGRGIRIDRDGSYPDGRSRYAVWPQGTIRLLARRTDDIDMAYIAGLRMATKRDSGLGGAPAYA